MPIDPIAITSVDRPQRSISFQLKSVREAQVNSPATPVRPIDAIAEERLDRDVLPERVVAQAEERFLSDELLANLIVSRLPTSTGYAEQAYLTSQLRQRELTILGSLIVSVYA